MENVSSLHSQKSTLRKWGGKLYQILVVQNGPLRAKGIRETTSAGRLCLLLYLDSGEGRGGGEYTLSTGGLLKKKVWKGAVSRSHSETCF